MFFLKNHVVIQKKKEKYSAYTEQQKKRPVNIFLSYLKLKYQKSIL